MLKGYEKKDDLLAHAEKIREIEVIAKFVMHAEINFTRKIFQLLGIWLGRTRRTGSQVYVRFLGVELMLLRAKLKSLKTKTHDFKKSGANSKGLVDKLKEEEEVWRVGR